VASITSEFKLKLDGCVPPALGPLNETLLLAKYISKAIVKTPDALVTTFVAISISDVTPATIVFLSSDKNITVRLNAQTDQGHLITAGDYMFLRGTEITAIEVNNSSGTDANLFLFVAGA